VHNSAQMSTEMQENMRYVNFCKICDAHCACMLARNRYPQLPDRHINRAGYNENDKCHWYSKSAYTQIPDITHTFILCLMLVLIAKQPRTHFNTTQLMLPQSTYRYSICLRIIRLNSTKYHQPKCQPRAIDIR